MAIALVDREARKARLVVGAVDGAPLVLERAAAEMAAGSDAAGLSRAVGADLAESGRGFSPAKLHLHRTVALRAIQNVGLS
jgi:carbon-monoxide dehydrogenase medium subunit